MSLILNIESTTTMCSVCLSKKGEAVEHMFINDGYSHAEKLAPFVDEILAKQSLKPQDLDAIAVSEGPGSYTGLRIGVSLAKGLCFSLNKPLISVPTMQAMCLNPKVVEKLNFYKDLLLCPMVDARRMEVYTAVYDIGLVPLMEPQPMVLDEASYSEFLSKEGLLFFGTGAEKFKSVVQSDSAYFVDDVWPTAVEVGKLAYNKFLNKQFEDVAYFEPFYLKEFVGTTPRPLQA